MFILCRIFFLIFFLLLILILLLLLLLIIIIITAGWRKKEDMHNSEEQMRVGDISGLNDQIFIWQSGINPRWKETGNLIRPGIKIDLSVLLNESELLWNFRYDSNNTILLEMGFHILWRQVYMVSDWMTLMTHDINFSGIIRNCNHRRLYTHSKRIFKLNDWKGKSFCQ